jgi:hypothetical protein
MIMNNIRYTSTQMVNFIQYLTNILNFFYLIGTVKSEYF